MSTKTALQIEDLLTLPEPPPGEHYELSRGDLIKVGRGSLQHELTKSRINRALERWNMQHELGFVLSESLMDLGGQTARQPDVAFVRGDRFAGADKDKLISIAPDLAVEVVSRTESAADAEVKVHEYLNAGVGEVWQVYPASRVVLIRTATGTREVREQDVLETSVLPGFQVQVSAFFD